MRAMIPSAILFLFLLLVSLPSSHQFSTTTTLLATITPSTPQQLGEFTRINRRLTESARPIVEHYDLTIPRNVAFNGDHQRGSHATDTNFGVPLIPYNMATTFQERLVKKASSPSSSSIADSLITLSHSPVYTLGSGPQKTANILLNQPSSPHQTTPIPIIPTRRGGEVTFHGPGQLVVYPILNLNSKYKKDLHWYLRGVEEVIIRGVRLASVDLLKGGRGLEEIPNLVRLPGVTGVFLPTSNSDSSTPPPPNYKVSSLGISARHWITLHGASLNVFPQSLIGYTGIKACGLENVEAGCLWNWFKDHGIIDESTERERVWLAVKRGVVEAFSEVFECNIVEPQHGAAFHVDEGEMTGEWL